jgi:hypothetical protein
VLAVARSATGGKCDGFLKRRARQVQMLVMWPVNLAGPFGFPVDIDAQGTRHFLDMHNSIGREKSVEEADVTPTCKPPHAILPACGNTQRRGVIPREIDRIPTSPLPNGEGEDRAH